jgi:FMN phosphatase YigB (HAD superfamily)
MKPTIKLLICDLDNTLYDWVTFFSRSVYAMVDEACRILGTQKEQLLDELQEVHRRYHNTEQPFGLLETKSVLAKYSTLERRDKYRVLNDAFHAFNSSRKRYLSLYPGVAEGLSRIKSNGTTIVAHTEATLVNAEYRLSKLGLTQFFDRLYALEHAGEPHPELEPMEPPVRVSHATVLFLHERKPDTRVLRRICGDVGVTNSESLYVGDSISRDIGMANEVGLHSAWAMYGTRYEKSDWERLVRITHWTAEDVHRAEAANKAYGASVPDVILKSRFDELLEHFAFAAHPQRVTHPASPS